MAELKNFFNYLIDKYSKTYDESIKCSSIPIAFQNEIQNEINQYLSENSIYNKYDKNSDNYVKHIVYVTILDIFSKALKQKIYAE